MEMLLDTATTFGAASINVVRLIGNIAPTADVAISLLLVAMMEPCAVAASI